MEGHKNKKEIIPIIDVKSAFKEKFKINGSVIQFKDQCDRKWYQLLGSLPIIQKKINKFTIEKTENRYIGLGIVSR